MYIKTKDRIIDVTYWDKDEHGYYPYLTDNWGEPKNYVYNEDIIKEAETIEDLCDGFYIDDGIQDVWKDDLYNSFEVFKDRFKQYKKCCIGNYIGYGFIKTDNCLKFVAKMNDKGELELL